MPPHRYRSILFDLYGAFIRDLGGWIAIADLVSLATPLEVDEHAVRSSVSRFSRKGLLDREVRRGQVGYALSDQGAAILSEGDLRIFDKLEPARLEDGWVLATFSVPERLRAERHQLRTRLSWLGFGNLGAGVWIAPRRVADRTIDTIREIGLDGYVDVFEASYRAFAEHTDLVRRCWNLDELQTVHTAYVERFSPTERRWRRRDPAEERRTAYVDYVTALHEWRKTPYLDPGLPVELLPDPWPGVTAAELFATLQERLEPAACRFVDEVVGVSDR
jgi:phenylacetic acid degradation operon negative regulatory protein